MEFRDLLDERSSIRSFQDKEVSEKIVREILEDANKAPSAGNKQARDFIVVRDKGKKERLAKAAFNQYFISRAPVVVVLVANEERAGRKYGKRGRELYSVVDSSLAAQNLMLSVTDKGLGTVWVGAFDEEKVSEIVNTPSYTKPIGIFPIGYPKGESKKTSRHDIEEITHREEF